MYLHELIEQAKKGAVLRHPEATHDVVMWPDGSLGTPFILHACWLDDRWEIAEPAPGACQRCNWLRYEEHTGLLDGLRRPCPLGGTVAADPGYNSTGEEPSKVKEEEHGGCPRCGGGMMRLRRAEGPYWHCFQCGENKSIDGNWCPADEDDTCPNCQQEPCVCCEGPSVTFDHARGEVVVEQTQNVTFARDRAQGVLSGIASVPGLLPGCEAWHWDADDTMWHSPDNLADIPQQMLDAPDSGWTGRYGYDDEKGGVIWSDKPRLLCRRLNAIVCEWFMRDGDLIPEDIFFATPCYVEMKKEAEDGRKDT